MPWYEKSDTKILLLAWYLPDRALIYHGMQELLYSDCFAHVQTQNFSVGLRAGVLKLCEKTCRLNMRISYV